MWGACLVCLRSWCEVHLMASNFNLVPSEVGMAARKQNCWEIMHCDEENKCSVRVNNINRCWEWMEKNNEFQYSYSLCYDCIVYLCNKKNSVLTKNELDYIMKMKNLNFPRQGL